MFKILKDKLKSFFGKEEKPTLKAKKTKVGKKAKEKKQKTSKKNNPVPIADGFEEFEEETKSKVNPELVDKKSVEVAEEKIDAEIKEEKKGFFSNLISKFNTSKITQEQVELIFNELEIILLESNVALEVVDKIRANLIESLVGQVVKSSEIKDKVITSIKDSINKVLVNPPDLLQEIKEKNGTYTILFFGINGTGKTTSIAKLATLLKKNNISCVLAAADTFRAAAIEQLEIHSKNVGVPIIKSDYSKDPTSVAFEAKTYAEKNKIKCVLIDTAGRMYTKENLIKQMEKLIRIIKPDKKIFVGESTAGNDMLDQIKTFNDAIGIDGIILSKADIDEKGGTALSVSHITNKPIYFLGTGQTYKDLETFDKKKILESLGLD